MHLSNQFSVSLLCKISQIDRSNYYKWLNSYKPNKYKDYDDNLKNIFEESYKTYGYRRLHIAMKTFGFNQNEKFLRARMKALNLKCEIRISKKNVKVINSDTYNKNPNYLNQKFKPEKPNKYFSQDITYLPTKSGMVYLNVILDLYGNRPVVCLSSYSCNSKLAEDSLDLLKNKNKNLRNKIIHNDQGVTYLSKKYIEKVISYKMIRSNSRRGYPYDNACSEHFFSDFKTEKYYRLGYMPENKEEVDEIVNEYIDFYLNKRISLSLNGLTPNQYYDNYIQTQKRLAKKAC